MKGLIGITATVLILSVGAAAGAPTPKPRGPVSVAVEAVGDAVPGQWAEFKVRASSAVEAKTFAVAVHPPSGFRLDSGRLLWTGSVRAGQPIRFRFSGTLPEKAKRLRVTASIRGAAVPIGNSTALHFGTPGSAKPRARVPPGERGVHEIPVK